MAAMPSPARTVARSVSVCRRLGMTDAEAAIVIVLCCNIIIDAGQREPPWDCTWARDVKAAALARLNTWRTQTTRPTDGPGQQEGTGA